MLTFLQKPYVCDGEDSLLVSMVTLIPVSINLVTNGQNITLREDEEHGGREQKRRYGKGDEGERKGRVKKEAVKKLIIC